MTQLDIIFFTIYEQQVQLHTCTDERLARKLCDNIDALWLEYTAEAARSGRLFPLKNVYI